jgi:hypothetical protein
VTDLLIWAALGVGLVLGVGFHVLVRWLLHSHEQAAQILATMQAFVAGISVLLVLVIGMLPYLEASPMVRLLRGVRELGAAAKAVVVSARSRRAIRVIAFVTIASISYATWTAIVGFFGPELDTLTPKPEVGWYWPLIGLGIGGVASVCAEKWARSR